jgi:pimeloyl-ACP methyl ester carboxylesterase
MSLTGKRTVAAGAGLLRKAIPARGWRRYVTGGIVVALAAASTVTAVAAQPAQAAHVQSAPKAASTTDYGCTPPPSPYLAGFKQGQVAIPGDSIHYVIGGSGPVLVLLAGWPITWWEFSTIMPTLEKNYTVVALDLPGLGNSTFPANGQPNGDGFTGADIATDLHAAVGALGYGNDTISILGHDLGANLAYVYARLYTSQVKRVMVLESALNGYGLESLYSAAFHFLLNMSAPPTPEDIVNNVESSDAYLNYLYSFAVKPGSITPQDLRIWDADYACPQNREAGYDYYRAFTQDSTFDTTTNTSKLTVPMAAMGGEDSFGDFVAQSFGNVDSDVSTIIAPGSGHYIAEEDPAFLAECATLFFSPNPPTTAPSGYATCLP